MVCEIHTSSLDQQHSFRRHPDVLPPSLPASNLTPFLAYFKVRHTQEKRGETSLACVFLFAGLPYPGHLTSLPLAPAFPPLSLTRREDTKSLSSGHLTPLVELNTRQ